MTELIDSEIHDQKHYAKLASRYKTEYPSLAQAFYNLSTQEEAHHATLHNEVVKIIEQYRKEKGVPPASMMAVYDYLHKQHIEKAAEAKRYQDAFKNA